MPLFFLFCYGGERVKVILIISDKQKNCIEWIEDTLDIAFDGKTKADAIKFIGENIHKAKLEQELEGVILESNLDALY